MENFNQTQSEHQPEVKEKNIYLLHLDNGRIIVLSSIIIGIIAIAFLIGMKIDSSSKAEADLFNTEDLAVSSMQSSSDMNELFQDDFLQSNDVSANDQLSADNEKVDDSKSLTPEKEAGDVLASGNVNIVKPENDKISVKPTAPKKKAEVKPTVSKKKTVATKPASGTYSKPAKPAVKLPVQGYVIQIASYDNIETARKEKARLTDMRYKAYIDDAYVNGVKYYRVRIGPFKSKDQGLSALNSIQRINRYNESYMIKEG